MCNLTHLFLKFRCKLQPMKIKPKWLSVVFAVLFCSGAFASPATDLFHQVKIYMQINYNGFSKLDLAAHLKKYEALLVQACAPAKDSCDYAVARELINKMINELEDGHTYYLTPEDYDQRNREQSGQTSNVLRIGILYDRIPGSSDYVISRVVSGGPASEAGLLRGDRLTAINKQAFPSVDDKLDPKSAAFAEQEKTSRAFLTAFVRGGKPFVLSVLRAGKPLEINLQGQAFSAGELPFWVRVPGLPAGVAVMSLPSFTTRGTAQKMHELFAQAIQYNIQTVIIDERDNGGGLVSETVAGISSFLPDVTLAFNSRYNREEYSYRAGLLFILDSSDPESGLGLRINNPVKYRGQIAVLVNSESASGAEVAADAVQYAKRGVVIGEKTFGIANTGTFPSALIDKGAIEITHIRTVHANGTPLPDFVTPNYEVKNDLTELMKSGRDLMLEKALTVFGYKAQ
jgi:carboxyl-terminal processing protease